MYTHVQKYYEISSIIHVLASLSFFPQTLISKIVDEYAYSFAIWYHFIILINKNKKLLPNDFQNPKSWRKGDLEFHNYNSTFQSSHSSIASTIKTSGGSPPPLLKPATGSSHKSVIQCYFGNKHSDQYIRVLLRVYFLFLF